jgi:hypothetical protein
VPKTAAVNQIPPAESGGSRQPEGERDQQADSHERNDWAVSSTPGHVEITTPPVAHDLTTLDDDQLISQRAALRARLGQLPWYDEQHAELEQQYEVLTDEFDRRARAAWRQAAPAADEQDGSAPAERQP